MNGLIRSFLTEFFVVNGRFRQFTVERGPKCDASTHEFRPGRYGHVRIHGFGQQAPELGVKPTQIMAGTIAMSADPCAQPLYLRDQCSVVHAVEILVHSLLRPNCRWEVLE